MSKESRPKTLHVPLPFDAFVSGILKVDPKKIKGKPAKKGKKPKAGRKPPAA
jgi:hypothetical protein